MGQDEFRTLFTGITLAKQKSYENSRAKPKPLYMQELSSCTGIPETDLLNKKLTKSNIPLHPLTEDKKDQNVPRGTSDKKKLNYDGEYTVSDLIAQLDARRAEMTEAKQRADLITDRLLDLFKSNLAKNTGYLETIIASGAARTEEIMKVFDKMNSEPPGTMNARAGMKELQFVNNLRKTGNLHGEDRKDKGNPPD